MLDEKVVLLEFAVQTNFNCENLSELLDELSDEFAHHYVKEYDAQEAFNVLDAECKGLLSKYFLYTLSEDGEMWSVDVGEGFMQENLPNYINEFKECYGDKNIETLGDLLSSLERKLMKDMSNVGCDAKTALRMTMDDLGLENEFYVFGANANPRIVE